MDQTSYTVSVESWGWTAAGDLRGENQDGFLNWPERTLWAVADGVGGSEFGGKASKRIIRDLMNIPPPEDLDTHVERVLRQLDRSNVRLYREGEGKASSTIVVLILQDGMAVCLWSGDSRCYLLRKGMLYQCSKDHTLRQQKIDDGSLTAPEAERMIQGNIITNAIGVNPSARVEQVRFALSPGDRFLLCSDGLSKIMAPQSLAEMLLSSSAKEAAESIVDTVSYLIQPDNLTFITIFVSNLK